MTNHDDVEERQRKVDRKQRRFEQFLGFMVGSFLCFVVFFVLIGLMRLLSLVGIREVESGFGLMAVFIAFLFERQISNRERIAKETQELMKYLLAAVRSSSSRTDPVQAEPEDEEIQKN